jgi:hypothetical protein
MRSAKLRIFSGEKNSKALLAIGDTTRSEEGARRDFKSVEKGRRKMKLAGDEQR